MVPPDLYEQVHISCIKPGDTVLIKGVLKTVCPKDLSYEPFMRYALWGDSYHLGRLLITRVTFGAEIARQQRTA